MRKLYTTFGALFLFLFGAVNYAFALNCPEGQMETDLGCLPTDPVGFVEKFYAWGLWLISFVTVLFIIIGGYYIMTARGNPEQIAKGKSFIFYSIAGVLLAIFGFVFIEIITGQILKIPGFN
jgi:hypothetical protein